MTKVFHIAKGISNDLLPEIRIPKLKEIIWIELIINSIMYSIIENQKSNIKLEINIPAIPNVIKKQKLISPFIANKKKEQIIKKTIIKQKFTIKIW
jgi:hypothetical protein